MLRFKGFPRGQSVELSVSNGGNTVGPVKVRRWNTPYPTHQFEPQQAQPFGVSVTVANPREFPVKGLQPKGRCHSQVVTQTDGRKLAMDWQIDNFNNLRDRAWIGASVDAYRIVSGERVFLGTYSVVDANFGEWRRAGGNDSTAYTQAGGFSHHHASFGRPDVHWEMRPRWFGVAAVDGSNQIGAIGYAEYTPTSLETGSNLSNTNTVSLGSSYTWGGPLDAPANVTATPDASGPATANVAHGAVTGAVGYVHFLTWDDPSTHPPFKYMEVDGDGILPGDEIVVRQKFLTLDPDFLATRTMGLAGVYGADALSPGQRYALGALAERKGVIDTSIIPYDGPDSTSIDWAVKHEFLAGSGTGAMDIFVDFWNAEATGSWYAFVPVGRRYRFLVRVWASRAAQIRLDTGLNGAPSSTYQVSPGWQTLELIGSPVYPAQNPLAARIALIRDGSPIEIRLADVKMQSDNATPLFPTDIAAQLLPGMAVRDHTFIKVMPNGYTIDDLLTGDFQGYNNYSIHQFLKSCDAASVKPWLQVEPFLNPAEWEFLGDYLSAPVASGKPGALRRQALGRTEPWTDAFDEILLEIGNEAWNGLGEFFNPPFQSTDSVTGASYNSAGNFGLMARQAAQILLGLADWPSHIKFVLGGHAAIPGFADNFMRTFRLPCYVGIANYNGGWDTGGTLVTENDTSYQNTLASTAASQIAEMDNLVSMLQSVCTEIGLIYGTDVRPTCYEAGPGYQLNGLNGSTLTADDVITQEVVMKSRAAGTATLHTALAQAARGFAHFNFFIIGTGNYWKSHAPEAQGGAVYPQWQVIRKLHELFGTMQVSKAPAQYPERITVQNHRGNDVEVDSTFVYGITSVTHPQRKGFVAGNIGIAAPQICRIDTGWATGDVATMGGWFLSGPYDAHNRYPVGQRLGPDGTYVADPKCVAIDIMGMSLMVPSDLSLIQTNNSLGFGTTGIGMGNCGFFVANA